ncbi:GNAT family N-acetyltransferase [Microbacterium marinum]|uniref:GNAT superfamily N-acetyltransferase n=1 Tax=Microbacterium marinum TaxID=421115 RepID=A0A7W7BSB3_9MICO|nr:GNAT family N-acetyltransferase [Microbacterium marinum]MBB4667932.1 GNAT superfamily N-acetyltransferase [Microbacterium marinum]
MSPEHGAVLRTFDDGTVLRAASPGDEAGLLAAIQALADYEREPDAVENTAADLTSSLFGPDPKVFAHVVEREERIVGIAIWFLTYSTWTGRHGIWLEDLFVDADQRGRGYGKALIASLGAVALQRGYSRVEWTVLDWNAPSIAFYRSLGAEPMDEWTTQRMSGPALEALARA